MYSFSLRVDFSYFYKIIIIIIDDFNLTTRGFFLLNHRRRETEKTTTALRRHEMFIVNVFFCFVFLRAFDCEEQYLISTKNARTRTLLSRYKDLVGDFESVAASCHILHKHTRA